ncbi:hypothetical protein HDU81_002683 [Chytriomyces hyalinus]|nr:hypothetical protein HDU81_002683 [Chytriomyces hyalinus]
MPFRGPVQLLAALSDTVTAPTASSVHASRRAFAINYAKLARWSSTAAAYSFMGIAILMALAMARNLIFGAKTRHTKAVYSFLLLWCIVRTAGFALRGYILTDDHGQDLTLFKWATILGGVGFMPLAQVLALCTLEGSALAFGSTPKARKPFDRLVRLLFVVSAATLAAFVIDFTCNKPLGSNVKDYTVDLVLREIGFNGLILVALYTLLGSIRNILTVVPQGKVPTVFVLRFRTMNVVVCFQSVLMLIKLGFTTYRNWNPLELRDEWIWYVLGIAPEYLLVLCYMNHGLLRVYDDIELSKLGSEETGDQPKPQELEGFLAA